jgi:hypothetical protein
MDYYQLLIGIAFFLALLAIGLAFVAEIFTEE